ncbi:MAG: hypothetical protein KGJ06_07445, partial [Pseudomonadota bacterium]|nr:hypothetical protein [Pseudomonadota bacterium]
MQTKARLVLFLSAFLYSASLLASTKDDLAQTQKDIEQAKAKQSELQKKNRAVEAELKELQKQLVQAAETIQGNEAGLSSAEEKLR